MSETETITYCDPYHNFARDIVAGDITYHYDKEMVVKESGYNEPGTAIKLKLMSQDWQALTVYWHPGKIVSVQPVWPVDCILNIESEEMRPIAYDLLIELLDKSFSTSGLSFYASLDEGQYIKALNTEVFNNIQRE